MRAIEVTGTVNNKGQLFLDKPLTVNKFTRVRVIVLLSDADSDVAQAIANCGKARNKEVAYSKMCCAT